MFHISSIKTSPYHPQSNGRLERFHSTLKAMISKSISVKHDWPVVLDLVLYFARNTPHSRHSFIPQESLFLKPTPYILYSLKSLWTSHSLPNVNLRVLKHSLSAKNPPNRPRLLGPIKLTSALPPNYFIYAGQQVLLGESTYREWRLEVDCISRNTPSPFWTSWQYCTATAVV